MAKNQLRTGAVLSYLNMAIGSLIPMIYTPLMLQLLGQSEYGLYKLSSTVTSYLSLLSLGVGSAVIRYLVKYKTEGDIEGEQKMFGLFNIIFTIISAIALLIGIIICFCLHLFYSNSLSADELAKMRVLVFILTINTAVGFSTTAYTAVVTCHEKFIFMQFVNLLLTVIPPVLNIIVLLLGYKSIGMTVSTLVISITVRMVYTLYIKKAIKIKPIYKNLPIHLVKELLIFSFWVFVSQLVNQLYNATDTLIIGSVPALATVGVAVYNVGATFNNMMLSFTQGINNVLTPKINTLVFSGSNKTELTDVVIRFGRLQCYIVSIVCSGFIVFGREFINLWVGAGYEDAFWVAIVTMIPTCIPLIQSVAMNIIVAQNRHRFRSLVFLGIAVVNVVGTWLCVNQFGIVGAAIVSGAAYIIGPVFIMNWYYYKKIGLEIPRFWKNVSTIFVIPLIMCVLSLIIFNFFPIDGWLKLLTAIIGYTIIFIVSNWKFIMNDYEKDIFRQPINKLTRKFKRGN